MTSFVAHSTRQPVRDSNCVGTVSSNTVRTAPVAVSATRSQTCLCSRDTDARASREPSGLQL